MESNRKKKIHSAFERETLGVIEDRQKQIHSALGRQSWGVIEFFGLMYAKCIRKRKKQLYSTIEGETLRK